jgi:hypothetical protein
MCTPGCLADVQALNSVKLTAECFSQVSARAFLMSKTLRPLAPSSFSRHTSILELAQRVR